MEHCRGKVARIKQFHIVSALLVRFNIIIIAVCTDSYVRTQCNAEMGDE